jgi:hypothetical protein
MLPVELAYLSSAQPVTAYAAHASHQPLLVQLDTPIMKQKAFTLYYSISSPPKGPTFASYLLLTFITLLFKE